MKIEIKIKFIIIKIQITSITDKIDIILKFKKQTNNIKYINNKFKT